MPGSEHFPASSEHSDAFRQRLRQVLKKTVPIDAMHHHSDTFRAQGQNKRAQLPPGVLASQQAP